MSDTPTFTLVGVCCALAAAAAALGAESTFTVRPGVYRITTETVLPHLEESLRYATTLTEPCLGTQEVSSLFPLLRHATFAGCVLTDGEFSGEQSVYVLACRNPQAASGTATLSTDGGTLIGVLQLKIGGKNMTLSQRARGPRVRACASQE